MQLAITLVGAGHYARDLILNKYLENKNCFVRCSLSPNSKIRGIGSIRSAKDWSKTYGEPSDLDVFDLCIHCRDIPKVLKSLIRIGAKNFILPKPVALTTKDWKTLVGLEKKYELNITVASQWFYSKKIDHLKRTLKRSEIVKTWFNFSQGYKPNGYTCSTALLPHMLQIAFLLGLPTKGRNFKVIKKGSNLGVINGNTEFYTDINSVVKMQKLIIYNRDTKSAVNLLSDEDNLKEMTDKTVKFFLNGDEKGVLTLDKYEPIARQQIKIENKI